ncbi:MAG TPA: hypothetical protein VLA72_19285 [Anaerolineales bacterium]|nr:hypothetical protein [Anaerolineales bacterium]
MSTFEKSLDTIETKIGSIVPAFNLMSSDDREISLSEFRGKRNVVLFFIREFN